MLLVLHAANHVSHKFRSFDRERRIDRIGSARPSVLEAASHLSKLSTEGSRPLENSNKYRSDSGDLLIQQRRILAYR